VTDVACTLPLIHTDKSKTKEKEIKEREKHCSGEDIPELCRAPWFLAGLLTSYLIFELKQPAAEI